jgi:pimeloyl-[acyl-carrier protein] methyl ester esterase
VEQAAGAADLPLVCLHGWALNLRVFDALRERRAGAPWQAIDLPGHGASPWDPARASFAAQVEWLLEALPPRCVLLGWSLGGQFALALARRAPERIARLVLVATTPRFAAAPGWPHGLAEGVLQNFRHQLTQSAAQTIADFLALQLRGSRNSGTVLAQLQQALLAQGGAQPAALAAGLRLLSEVDLRPVLRDVAQPCLVVSGQHDRITPAAAGDFLAAALPCARHALLARAGHAPFLSHADEFAALVEAFLAEPGVAPA